MASFIDTIKGLAVSNNLIHRVVVAEEANARQGTQSAKTRSEVRGGGKKPYKQKKTGNARQGTIRAPHYAHGGMALAVKPRDYSKKVNRKERRLALLGALGDHAVAGTLVIVDKVSFAKPSTKDAVKFLEKNGLNGTKRILIVLDEYEEATVKSLRNLPEVEVRIAPNKSGLGEGFSTRDLVIARKVVITKSGLASVEATYSGQEAEVAAPTKKATKVKKTEETAS
ncbi:MAG: 50S ribosomal protein L4 [Chthonomonadaceae bacterium]|jgi:large subunit ribosomal protein L4|nr:50S ribosomal protein L4 [Chthonomonadaceae bacterium]